jgi:hypothetical protein
MQSCPTRPVRESARLVGRKERLARSDRAADAEVSWNEISYSSHGITSVAVPRAEQVDP